MNLHIVLVRAVKEKQKAAEDIFGNMLKKWNKDMDSNIAFAVSFYKNNYYFFSNALIFCYI